MIRYAVLLLGSSLMLLGCASQPGLQPVSAEHPASPRGAEARPIPPSLALRPETQDSQRTQSPVAAPEASGPVPRHVHGTQHGAKLPEVPGQTQIAPAPATVLPAEQETGTTYVCPMHPDVIQTKPGSCPKCGMKLIKKELKK